MKKMLFFLLLFFIPFNVNALTFDKCGSTIEVDESNFIYYLYSNNTYKQVLTNNDYFILTKFVANGRYFLQSSKTSISRDNNGCYSGNWKSYRFNSDFSFYDESANRYGSNCGFNSTYQTPLFYNFNFKSTANVDVVSNISVQDLEDYFTCSSPPHFETKNEIFTSWLSTFVGYIPFVIVLILIFEGVGWFINKKD